MFCICTFLFSRWFQILCSLDQWTQFWSSFDRLWINLNWQYWLMPYWLWLRQKSENFKCPIIFFGTALACKKVLWISRTGHRDFCCYGPGSDTDTSCFGARSVGGASSFNILTNDIHTVDTHTQTFHTGVVRKRNQKSWRILSGRDLPQTTFKRKGRFLNVTQLQ